MLQLFFLQYHAEYYEPTFGLQHGSEYRILLPFTNRLLRKQLRVVIENELILSYSWDGRSFQEE